MVPSTVGVARAVADKSVVHSPRGSAVIVSSAEAVSRTVQPRDSMISGNPELDGDVLAIPVCGCLFWVGNEKVGSE